jgi:hypothetical protein
MKRRQLEITSVFADQRYTQSLGYTPASFRLFLSLAMQTALRWRNMDIFSFRP